MTITDNTKDNKSIFTKYMKEGRIPSPGYGT